MKSISNLAKLGRQEAENARLMHASVYTRAREGFVTESPGDPGPQGERGINPHKHKVADSEKDLEAELRERCKALGWMCIKLTSQYQRGLPDRLILMPGGRVCFAEIKTTGKKPTALQRVTHERLRALGYRVEVVDTTESLGNLIVDLQYEVQGA